MSITEHSEVVGVFRDQASVDQAVDALRQAGIGETQIRLTTYDPPAGDASQHASEMKRIIVHVKADGRESEIVGILVSHGANNGDLPEGTRLEHGSIISADPETVDLDLIPQKSPDSELSTDSLFGEVTEPGHPDEIRLEDNSNYPHG